MARKVRRIGSKFSVWKTQVPTPVGYVSAGYAVNTYNLMTPNLFTAFWTSGSEWNTGRRVFLKYIDITAKIEIGNEPLETRNKIVVFRPKDRSNNTEFDPLTGGWAFVDNLTTNMKNVPTTYGGAFDLDFLRFNKDRLTLHAVKSANLGMQYKYAIDPIPPIPPWPVYDKYPNKTHVTRKFRVPYNAWVENEVGVTGTASDWSNQTFLRDPSKNVFISFFSNNAAATGSPYVSYTAVYHFEKYD